MPGAVERVLPVPEGMSTFSRGAYFARLFPGDVSERPKVQLSKSCVGESPPWVQIPPSPPVFFIAISKLGQAGN